MHLYTKKSQGASSFHRFLDIEQKLKQIFSIISTHAIKFLCQVVKKYVWYVFYYCLGFSGYHFESNTFLIFLGRSLNLLFYFKQSSLGNLYFLVSYIFMFCNIFEETMQRELSSWATSYAALPSCSSGFSRESPQYPNFLSQTESDAPKYTNETNTLNEEEMSEPSPSTYMS